MDFSSDVLIDFGLNLAGYIIVALLTYILLGRRGRSEVKLSPAATCAATPMAAGRPLVERAVATTFAASDPEFIPLAHQSERKPDYGNREGAVVSGREDRSVKPLTVATRQENRRAIYQEARRLLASGRSRHELLHQLPLTEGELELLSVAGKA